MGLDVDMHMPCWRFRYNAGLRSVFGGVDTKELSEDFHIKIKLGMAMGPIVCAGHDLLGDAWEDCCSLGEDVAQVGELLVTTAVKKAMEAPPLDKVSLAPIQQIKRARGFCSNASHVRLPCAFSK